MEEQLKKLMEENIEYSKEIYHLSLKVKKYIFWGRIMAAIQLLFILIPIILGIVYLPSMLSGFFSGLGGFSGAPTDAAGSGLNGMFEQYQQILDLYK
ncbi:MAG: hypothetical protein ACKKL6_03045 [Candidatus Komeilibacteria bacterium]